MKSIKFPKQGYFLTILYQAGFLDRNDCNSAYNIYKGILECKRVGLDICHTYGYIGPNCFVVCYQWMDRIG